VSVRPQSDTSLVRLLQSHYLRDESRFDRWGGLGKVLLVQTVLRGNNITPLTGLYLEQLINTAFPRTFAPMPAITKMLDRKVVRAYHAEIRRAFIREGMDEDRANLQAQDEAAEKFCTTGLHILDCLT
jgi:hypothetical protein